MGILRTRWARITLVGLLCVFGIGGTRGPDDDSARRGRTRIHALASFQVVASGFDALAGVAVEPGSAILVTDRQAGTLTRIDATGRRRVLWRNLRRPTGVAVDGAGGVLVLDQDGRRLLRRAPDGLITVLASSLRQARGVAVGPGGEIWLSVRRIAGRDRDDDEDDRGGSEFVVARMNEAGTLTPFASGLIDVHGLAADSGALYIVMERLAAERGRVRTTLARIPVGADGKAGVIERLLRSSRAGPAGVAIDAAGDVFVAGDVNDHDGRRGDASAGVILKRRGDGRFGVFATGLHDPAALAFAPNGDLIVAESDPRGRVLRFLAPPPPVLVAPAFTNQMPLTLHGEAVAGARVTMARVEAPRTPLASVVAHSVSGAFTVQVPVEANAANGLAAVATAFRGAGLAGTPLAIEIVHDDEPPSLMIIEPVAGVHTRGQMLSSAQAGDERSGVAALLWSVDGVDAARLENSSPATSFSGTVVLATAALPEGPHAVDVVALDRAGNARVARVPVVVDRTPPETLILSGPAAEIAARTTTFTVSGTDASSAVEQLDYSWRLDAGPWSAFDALAAIALGDLLPGEHRFEVKARDRAGNEDATPAAQTFSVRSLRVRITDPVEGAIVTTPSVWLRGVVEGASEVTVTVPLPPGMAVTALPASTEAGTFAVEVPVDAATSTLTAVATDAATGATVTHTISVVVQLEAVEPLSGFTALPVAGLAPHVVTFSVNLGQGTRVELDLDSNGAFDFDGPTLDGLPFVYDRAGVYVPTLRATTADGQTLTYRTVVEVYDRAALDARLQAVWIGFTGALRSGDVGRVVSFVHGNRRGAWQEYFGQCPDDLAAVGNAFSAIELIQVGRGGAEYEMLREEGGRVFSYPVVFVVDIDGRWRLWQF